MITLEGDRNSLEIPVYGAKCLAIRDAILDLHGIPSSAGPWVRLADNAYAGNSTLTLVRVTILYKSDAGARRILLWIGQLATTFSFRLRLLTREYNSKPPSATRHLQARG